MRKYILNTAIIGAVASGFSVIQQTRKGPHDWRLLLTWISWGLTVALAIGGVMQDDREARELEENS